MIAGLEEITQGTVAIGDTVIDDVAPSRRGVAMVFLTYALYSHITVYKTYPLDENRPRHQQLKSTATCMPPQRYCKSMITLIAAQNICQAVIATAWPLAVLL